MLKDIYESTVISIPEVRKILLERANQGDLSYMQRLALEHAQLVTRIAAKDAVELVKLLMEKYQLSRNSAITLANYMPDNIHEIRQLLGKEASLMETETIESICEDLQSTNLIDKKDKEYTDALDKLDEDTEDESDDKEVDENMIPDDI